MSEIERITLDRLVVSDLNERTTEFDAEAGGQNIVNRTKANGDVDPPLKVRPAEDDDYDFEIVDGSRRYNSAVEAGLDSCSVIISRDMSDLEVMKETVASNVSGFQKSATIQERAAALRRIWREMGNEGLESARTLAAELGVSEATARNWLEPLRREWEGTPVHPQLSDNGELLTDQDTSGLLHDVSGRALREIRSLDDANSDERLTIVQRVDDGDLTASAVADAKRDFGDTRRTVEELLGHDTTPEPDIDPDEAIDEDDGTAAVDGTDGLGGGGGGDSEALLQMIDSDRIIQAAKHIHDNADGDSSCPVCGGK